MSYFLYEPVTPTLSLKVFIHIIFHDSVHIFAKSYIRFFSLLFKEAVMSPVLPGLILGYFATTTRKIIYIKGPAKPLLIFFSTHLLAVVAVAKL